MVERHFEVADWGFGLGYRRQQTFPHRVYLSLVDVGRKISSLDLIKQITQNVQSRYKRYDCALGPRI